MVKITVADLMTSGPFSVKPDTSLFDCAKTMVRKKVGSLLIVDKKDSKRLIGFISQHDILWALIKKSKEDLSKIKAIDISPRKIATIRPEATIEEVIRKMKRLKFERLPVIQGKNLVGMITVKDILNFNPELYPEVEEFSKIREESEKLKRLKTKSNEFIQDGICEECGNIGQLQKIDGTSICISCKDAM